MTHFNNTIYKDLVQNNFWRLPVSPLCPIRHVTRRKSYFIYVFRQNLSLISFLPTSFLPFAFFLSLLTSINLAQAFQVHHLVLILQRRNKLNYSLCNVKKLSYVHGYLLPKEHVLSLTPTQIYYQRNKSPMKCCLAILEKCLDTFLGLWSHLWHS